MALSRRLERVPTFLVPIINPSFADNSRLPVVPKLCPKFVRNIEKHLKTSKRIERGKAL